MLTSPATAGCARLFRSGAAPLTSCTSRTLAEMAKRRLNDGTIAPSSGHSPFQRAPLPSFPSTSFLHSGSPSTTSSPYVTDNLSASNPFAYDASFDAPTPSTTMPSEHRASNYAAVSAPPRSPPSDSKATDLTSPGRSQTLEEMYSAPENTLEIEVRDPRTQGRSSVAIAVQRLTCARRVWQEDVHRLRDSLQSMSNNSSSRSMANLKCHRQTSPRSRSATRLSGEGIRISKHSETSLSAKAHESTYQRCPAKSLVAGQSSAHPARRGRLIGTGSRTR